MTFGFTFLLFFLAAHRVLPIVAVSVVDGTWRSSASVSIVAARATTGICRHNGVATPKSVPSPNSWTATASVSDASHTLTASSIGGTSVARLNAGLFRLFACLCRRAWPRGPSWRRWWRRRRWSALLLVISSHIDRISLKINATFIFLCCYFLCVAILFSISSNIWRKHKTSLFVVRPWLNKTTFAKSEKKWFRSPSFFWILPILLWNDKGNDNFFPIFMFQTVVDLLIHIL